MTKKLRLLIALACAAGVPQITTAADYSENILDDVKMYRSYKNKETPVVTDACGSIKDSINKNSEFKNNNLSVACIRQPGKITLSVPNFRKIAVADLPQGMLNSWLQNIYATASENGAGLIHLHLSDNIRQERGTILSINTKDNLSGVFSDWKKINFATAAAQSDTETPYTKNKKPIQTSKQNTETQQPQATPIYSSGLNDSLPPPPPYKF